MNLARLYLGALLVALGIVIALDGADVLDAGEFIARWWPVTIIGAAAIQWITAPRHWLGPLVVGGIGVLLLLNTTDALGGDLWPFVWALAFVVVGIAVLVDAVGGRRAIEHTVDRISGFAAFGGRKLVVRSKHFEGGAVGSVFGATELDLREADLAPDAALDVFAAFGGVEIRVPPGWRVVIHGTPIFGAIDDKTEGGGDELAPTLHVRATVLFGGLEVKN